MRDIMELYERGKLKLCNCSVCGVELIGTSHAEEYMRAKSEGVLVSALPKLMAGRVDGKPYCDRCISNDNPQSLADSLCRRQAHKLRSTSGG